MSRRRKLQWWAACDGVACSGPYPTQEAAWRSLECAAQSEQTGDGRVYTMVSTVHVPGARVWPAYDQPRVVYVRRRGEP